MNDEIILQLSRVPLFLSAGVIWSISADILSIVQCKCRYRCIKMLTDFIWMSSAGLIIFILTVSIMQDNLRGYMLFSFISAAVLWHITGGRVLRKLLGLMLCVSYRIVCAVYKGIKTVFYAVSRPFIKIKSKNNEKKIAED